MKNILVCLIILWTATVATATPSVHAKSFLVIDLTNNVVMLEKNPQVVRPIASITKFMSALAIMEANQPLDQVIEVTEEDAKNAEYTGKNLRVGTLLTREQLLNMSLINSHNRATTSLARSYPGGMSQLVIEMNHIAARLGMHDTKFADPTGLNPENSSTARDLTLLLKQISKHPLLEHISSSPVIDVEISNTLVKFKTTNPLVMLPSWNIIAQKTGYIAKAGRCVVLITTIATKQFLIVSLNSSTTKHRTNDVIAIKRWIESQL